LEYANHQVAARGLSERIEFKQGEIQDLPFEADSFDWIWSADCIGYPVGDLLPILRELKRVLKPGGKAAILAWSSQSFLPGYPLLEARLNATCSAYAPFVRGKDPKVHFMRAMNWFTAAGFEEVHGRTFVADVQGPLSEDMKVALSSLFEMLWGEPREEASAEDRSEYRRLCTLESADSILNLQEYYGFFTYTVFQGAAPAG
jgi:demethylmenaquinone methyltransferase/2-methoxy-6-polyprenyl-1,4-benzoquinol methylase